MGIKECHLDMMRSLRRDIRLGVYATLSAIVLLFAFIVTIDLVEQLRRDVASDHKATGYEQYVERLSKYSLVSLGILDIQHFGALQIDRSKRLYECIGNFRGVHNGHFVDIAALTISIIGIENYNRGPFRRKFEVYMQDLARQLGREADFTIGIAQIRSSIAEMMIKRHIKVDAKQEEVDNWTRSDCGSANLASYLVEFYLRQCVERDQAQTIEVLVSCVSTNYSSGRDRRERSLYARVALRSYGFLFDSNNEFYRTYFLSKYAMDAVKSGECVEFNFGRSQFKGIPQDKSLGEFDAANEAASEGEKVTIVVEGERIDYSSVLPEDRGARVKIFLSVNAVSSPIEIARRKKLLEYVCSKFEPVSVEFYPRSILFPNKIARYCVGADPAEPPSEAYIILNASGSLLATQVEQCSKPSPRNPRP